MKLYIDEKPADGEYSNVREASAAADNIPLSKKVEIREGKKTWFTRVLLNDGAIEWWGGDLCK